MIEIFPVSKIEIDSLGTHEELLVCLRDPKGKLLLITELKRYLKIRSRRKQYGIKSLKSVPQHICTYVCKHG